MAIGQRFLFFVGLLAAVPLVSEGANVLVAFTSHSPSHIIVHMPYVKILVERGHNVTVLTTLPIKENFGFHHIFIPPSEEAHQAMEDVKSNLMKTTGSLRFVKTISKVISTFGRASYEAIKDPRVQDLIHNPAYKFELMILGYFMNDYELGIAAHMKCPIIISWPATSNYLIERYVGNPSEISYVPFSPILPPGDPLTFSGRLRNFMLFGLTRTLITALDWYMGHIYTDLFPPTEYPSLTEMAKRVSLVFANSHFSEGVVRPSVPALVDVGGIQIKDRPDPLPETLRAIVDAASEHGVIYLSFGTNLQSKFLEGGFLQNIYEVLASVKQTVLWKWDGANKPGNATNIHFEKWLPQDDLLAHPNVKLFITHAGKGSVVESQYHGVPMVAIPMFGDQPSNAQKLVEDGYGIKVDHSTMTADSLRSTILEVLQNPVYREKVNRFSRLYRDRPMTARETAAYWMEYVMRHKGAYHMQSPLVHLNGLQYLSLDVIVFLLLAAYVTFQIMRFSVKLTCKLLSGVLCSKKQKVKKH